MKRRSKYAARCRYIFVAYMLLVEVRIFVGMEEYEWEEGRHLIGRLHSLAFAQTANETDVSEISLSFFVFILNVLAVCVCVCVCACMCVCVCVGVCVRV